MSPSIRGWQAPRRICGGSGVDTGGGVIYGAESSDDGGLSGGGGRARGAGFGLASGPPRGEGLGVESGGGTGVGVGADEGTGGHSSLWLLFVAYLYVNEAAPVLYQVVNKAVVLHQSVYLGEAAVLLMKLAGPRNWRSRRKSRACIGKQVAAEPLQK